MTPLDLLLLAVATAALGCSIYLVIAGPRRRPPVAPEALAGSLGDLGSLKWQLEAIGMQQLGLAQTLSTLQSAVAGVETRVVQSSAGMQAAITRELQEARVAVERLKADADARQRLDDELQASSRRIEAVLLGSRSRGLAGENILDEAFRELPPDMIERNFRVNGKVVEYALVLANAKRLPVDSKWPSPELLDRMREEAASPSSEPHATAEIERVLRAKVREVRQYIDPAVTLSFAIAAVPDAVFLACRRAHLEAYREGVVLLPYSMTLPYVLTLFRLHLQYARSIDLENLEGSLQQIEDNVNELERSLENSISRGSIMIQNAFIECKRNVGQMRGALAALRALPEAGLAPAQPAVLERSGQGGLPVRVLAGQLDRAE